MSLHIRRSPHREWRRVTKISKARTSGTGEDALRRLRSFLDAEEPQVVRILARLWEDQQQAITYAELRTAVLNGVIDEQTAQDWMNDYAHFFNDKLRPRMEDAMRTANAKLEADLPGLFFNAHDPGVQDWLSTRGGELITVIGGEQRRAINAMIGRAYTGEWSVDELSRVIRPTIGLNRPQAIANMNYYETVRRGLLENNPTMRQATAAKRAREAAVKYAERQHRYRAFMIARTEMAFAYNRGMDEGIKQAIAKGYMGPCVRVWATAADERMCPVCGELEGVEIGMEGEYDFSIVNRRLPSGPTPPAHPNCRCAVDYREIAPPDYQERRVAEGNRISLDEKDLLSDSDYAMMNPQGMEAADDTNWKTVNFNQVQPIQNGFSAFPPGDVLNDYVKNVPPLEGYFDVGMHGTPQRVCFGYENENMTAHALAEIIRRDSNYHGGPIRLLACSTGKTPDDGGYCFAEELSNALGVEVIAPNDKLYIYMSGKVRVGQGEKEKGFISFQPNQRRRMK